MTMTTELDGPPGPEPPVEAVYEPLVSLHPSWSTEAALRRIHSALLQRILDNQTGVREGRGGEHLHDYRVAVRRTRTGLRGIRQVYPKPAAKRFAGDFRWLSKTTGPARDLQVYLRAFEQLGRNVGAEVIEGLEPFADFLRSQRRREEERCAQALASRRYAEMMRDWERFLQEPAGGDETTMNACRPVREVGMACVESAYHRAVQRGAALHERSAGESFHRVRLDFKKLRYLLEFFSSLFAEAAWKRSIGTLKRTQDALGAINDLRVQAEWLDRFPAPETDATLRLRGWLQNQQSSERRLFLERLQELLDNDGASLQRLLAIAPATH